MGDAGIGLPKRRQLPKLIACMTKNSLENMRNKYLFSMDALDAKGIRRRKKPLWECLILELRESGYTDSSSYLQDLLYDNAQLVSEDDIGIVVDLRNREDYLEHICGKLQQAEKERERDNIKKECMTFLKLALYYAEKGKGILWLAEKFFLASIAVASKFLLDGGRLKGVCKYHYAKFLLDKFPGADPEESFLILTEVRDSAIGKSWLLDEPEKNKEESSNVMLFSATAVQLHRVLLSKSRAIRKADTAKAERLARLAERRGVDADDAPRTAEAIIEVGICQLMMNNLNNAKKTFERAFQINTNTRNIEGLCITRMHLAAVMQRLGDHETAARLLTEMGALAMEHGLRRQLGRALHLLGELHLRRERPELGTQHLTEAFFCFMGYSYASGYKADPSLHTEINNNLSIMDIVYDTTNTEVYVEEAEQSRLMTAISAGQELMASYFDLLREAKLCTISTVKCIEWKLQKSSWWIKRHHHDLLPCPCAIHNRSPLDVLRFQLQLIADRVNREQSEGISISNRGQAENQSYDDLMRLHSSRMHPEDNLTSKSLTKSKGITSRTENKSKTDKTSLAGSQHKSLTKQNKSQTSQRKMK